MRVLVVGDPDARGALTAVRSLGRAGWSVGVATAAPRGLLLHSRWVRSRHRLPGADDPALASSLAAVLRDGGYETAFVTGDDWVAALLGARERLPVPLAFPPTASVLAVLDKLSLARLSAEAGIAAPRTVVADDAACASWRGQAVVKSRSHAAGTGSGPRAEAVLVDDGAAAAGAAAQLRAAGSEPLLQEVVHGGLLALTLLLDQGRVLARVQQRALAVWPQPAGISARAVTEPVDERLAGPLTELLRGLDWTGLAQAQYLTGPDGPVLIDVNPRYYGSMALSAAAGVDLAGLWAAVATGRPAAPVPDARPGVRYVWLEGDLRRALAERRGGLLADAAGTVRWAGRASHSVASAADPLPLAVAAGDLAARGARLAWRRMSR